MYQKRYVLEVIYEIEENVQELLSEFREAGLPVDEKNLVECFKEVNEKISGMEEQIDSLTNEKALYLHK